MPSAREIIVYHIQMHSTELIDLIKNLLSKIDNLMGNANTAPKYYSRKEVQEMLGIGKNLMDKYIADGYISYSRPDGDKMFFSQKDIDDFMQNYRHEAFHNNYAYGTRA